jgi:hypothetical protein
MGQRLAGRCNKSIRGWRQVEAKAARCVGHLLDFICLMEVYALVFGCAGPPDKTTGPGVGTGPTTENITLQATQGTVIGTLPGSILPAAPAGKTWVNDFDEEFDGSSINTATWQVFNNYTVTSGQYCNRDETQLTVSGGFANFTSFDYRGTPCPQDGTVAGGAAIISQNFYGPGYYEARLIGDPHGGGPDFQSFGGSGFWFDAAMSSRGGNWAQNGTEVDLLEYKNTSAHNEIIWGGYGPFTSDQEYITGLNPSDAFHVWGLYYSPTEGYKFFKDGVQTAPTGPGSNVVNGFANDGSCTVSTPCTKPMEIFLNNNMEDNGNTTVGTMQVDWVRHYVLQ